MQQRLQRLKTVNISTTRSDVFLCATVFGIRSTNGLTLKLYNASVMPSAPPPTAVAVTAAAAEAAVATAATI